MISRQKHRSLFVFAEFFRQRLFVFWDIRGTNPPAAHALESPHAPRSRTDRRRLGRPTDHRSRADERSGAEQSRPDPQTAAAVTGCGAEQTAAQDAAGRTAAHTHESPQTEEAAAHAPPLNEKPHTLTNHRTDHGRTESRQHERITAHTKDRTG